MDVSTEKVKTSPYRRAMVQAYIDGLIEAERLLKKSENLVDNHKLLKAKISEEKRKLGRM